MRDPVDHIKSAIVALAFAITPHVPDLPIWITVWCAFFWGYLLYMEKKRRPPPRRSVRVALTLAGFAGVVLGTGLEFGGGFYVSLLSVMSGLKPLEIKSHRDRMVTVFLAYFLVITSLFKSESLATTVYMFLSVLVTTAALIRLNHPGGRMRGHLRLSAKIMAQALPLMAILFFLFPRIHSSFWGFSGRMGKTGFSDEIAPGQLASLVESNEIAFRTEFKGTVPDSRHMYWRGIVFWKFDGKKWREGLSVPTLYKQPRSGETVEYAVVLEPRRSRRIFALDLPVSRPPRTQVLADYTLLSRRYITKKMRFELKSRIAYTSTGNLELWEQSAPFQLPEEGGHKARALAEKWAGEAGDDSEAIVKKAVRYFQNNGFAYSLKSPILGDDPIDEFLFETRKGYCEHYASAFAFLLRAADVPCRLVGGYLGGELNPYGGYVIIRESDAHVWTEVWLQNRGWVRIDPTLAVAPRRISGGIEASVPSDELPGFLSFRKYGPMAATWQKIRFGWDAINSAWDIWFSGYSFEQQKAALEKLGIRVRSWRGLAKTLLPAAAGVIIMAILAALWSAKKPSGKKEPVLDIYIRFCAMFEKTGITRNPAEGPADFAKKVCAARTDLKPEVETIIELYIKLRYGRGGGAEDVKRFKSLVRRLNGKLGGHTSASSMP